MLALLSINAKTATEVLELRIDAPDFELTPANARDAITINTGRNALQAISWRPPSNARTVQIKSGLAWLA
jgi:hypothetical protein